MQQANVVLIVEHKYINFIQKSSTGFRWLYSSKIALNWWDARWDIHTYSFIHYCHKTVRRKSREKIIYKNISTILNKIATKATKWLIFSWWSYKNCRKFNSLRKKPDALELTNSIYIICKNHFIFPNLNRSLKVQILLLENHK